MTHYETILLEKYERVALITLNRPEKLNSFNSTLRREFCDVALKINKDDNIWVVVLTGAGRAFGAGADLSDTESPLPLVGDQVEHMLNEEYKPGIMEIYNAPKPWVAAINGPCAGISYSYAMACDLVLMAATSYLYQPFSNIGLIPDGGATKLLPELIGPKRAYELMVFGEKVGAEKAIQIGLANRILPDKRFLEETMTFARDLAGRSPLSLRYTKEALHFSATSTLADSISKEAAVQSYCVDSEDARDAALAFFEKRKPNWAGK